MIAIGDRRREDAALAKNIGERMRKARESLNMTQIEAAKKLGYSNPSKLAKVENASDTESVPFALIFRAAGLYDVTTDWLYGLSEDKDGADTTSQVVAMALDEWERIRKRDFAAIMAIASRVERLSRCIDLFVSLSDEANAAMSFIRDKNQGVDDIGGGWEDIRGGSRLESIMQRLQYANKNAKDEIDRFRRFDRSRINCGQEILFKKDEHG